MTHGDKAVREEDRGEEKTNNFGEIAGQCGEEKEEMTMPPLFSLFQARLLKCTIHRQKKLA